MQPAHMNMRIHTIRKTQIKVSDIFYTRLYMGMGLDFNLLRLFSKQIEQNRNIMGGQIPDHIDIIAEESKVDTLCFNTIDLSQVTILNQLFQLIDCWIILKRMPNHQNQSTLTGQF